MKELDTAMSAYLQHHYNSADDDEKQLFAQLLEEQDPHIMALLNDASSSRYRAIIRKIRDTIGAAG